jgi:hypothetical protein
MRYRFLVHSLSHTFLVVDITDIGLPTEVYPANGRQQSVSALRFQSWRDVEEYFLKLGADPEAIKLASDRLKARSVDVLTIV